MPMPRHLSERTLAQYLESYSSEHLIKRLQPRLPDDDPLPPRLPDIRDYSEDALKTRRTLLLNQGTDVSRLASRHELAAADLTGNIENYIGTVEIPVGLIGPLRINGVHAQGDYYVPLATHEGALVASYNRGAYVISQSGGASAVCLAESVSRAPVFIFESIAESGQFVSHVMKKYESFQSVVSGTSNYCKLLDMQSTINGKEVYLMFMFTTGDAAGQNMVTIATNALCNHILEDCPIKPQRWFIEGNLSGDKKATMQSFLSNRGKHIVSEVKIPRSLVERALHTTPEVMKEYWEISFVAGAQTGSIGSQGHFANGLAALFIACGQDAACVSEASVGVTRLDVTKEGDLYASVNLPNIIVGTVGGGTWLPDAQTCLEMLHMNEKGTANAFAELCGVTVLAGEISIIAALASGDFCSAHETFGRKSKSQRK